MLRMKRSRVIAEFQKKLKPDGAVFLHHSNLGEYINRVNVQSRLLETRLLKVPKLLGVLKGLGILEEDNWHWRARSMTAKKMAMFAEQHHLQCISQELITWGTKFVLLDCLSTLGPSDSKWSRQNRVIRNYKFMREAERLSYCRVYIDTDVVASALTLNPIDYRPPEC